MKKACKTCEMILDVSEFYPHKLTKDGSRGDCKKCGKQKTKDYNNSPIGRIKDKARNKTLQRKKWRTMFNKKMYHKHIDKKRINKKFSRWFNISGMKRAPCQVCGIETQIDAHHPDYNKPFEVMWLCRSHHQKWHQGNKAIPLISQH